jgi:hypothetical protein
VVLVEDRDPQDDDAWKMTMMFLFPSFTLLFLCRPVTLVRHNHPPLLTAR